MPWSPLSLHFYPLKNTIASHPLELAESQALERGWAEKRALLTQLLVVLRHEGHCPRSYLL